MYPIVMVANFSGNVGKTTVTKNLLAPNMPGVRIFAVEDVNAGYNQGEATQMPAEMAKTILEEAIEASFESPVIVDVGASNVAVFFSHFSSYEGIQELITRVIVPTEPSEKVQTDTVKTVEYLIKELFFDPEKIAVIINKADARMDDAVVFETMLNGLIEHGVIPVGTLHKNDTFQAAAQMKKTIYELAQSDIKQLLQDSQFAHLEGSDPKAKVRMTLAASSSRKLKSQLDALFAKLNISLDDA